MKHPFCKKHNEVILSAIEIIISRDNAIELLLSFITSLEIMTLDDQIKFAKLIQLIRSNKEMSEKFIKDTDQLILEQSSSTGEN